MLLIAPPVHHIGPPIDNDRHKSVSTLATRQHTSQRHTIWQSYFSVNFFFVRARVSFCRRFDASASNPCVQRVITSQSQHNTSLQPNPSENNELNIITCIIELPFIKSRPLCFCTFFTCSMISVTRLLSTSTKRKAVMFTLLYLKSSKSNDSMSCVGDE